MNWSKISLVFFFIVALIGTLLRSPFITVIPLKYSNLVHTHSHVAFQGWIYTLMILFLTHQFLDRQQITASKYKLQFVLTCIVMIGVLISFSLQGYGRYSIIFSTLFQLLNYWFIYCFFKDVRNTEDEIAKSLSLRFVKTGLWLGIGSTLIPVGIGIVSAKGLNGSELYRSLVYTFLHLQYNGWFLFVALGLFYRHLKANKIDYQQQYAARFYRLYTLAVLPAITLSLLGMNFATRLLPLAYLSAGIQGIGIYYFTLSHHRMIRGIVKERINWMNVFLLAFLVFFPFKTILQCLSVVPLFKPYAFFNKLIILAYLHLSLIGVISFLFLALMMSSKWISNNCLSKTGNMLLFLGFVMTESMLALGGFGMIYNQQIMFIGSAMMASGILFLIVSKTQTVSGKNLFSFN